MTRFSTARGCNDRDYFLCMSVICRLVEDWGVCWEISETRTPVVSLELFFFSSSEFFSFNFSFVRRENRSNNFGTLNIIATSKTIVCFWCSSVQQIRGRTWGFSRVFVRKRETTKERISIAVNWFRWRVPISKGKIVETYSSHKKEPTD